MNEIKRVILGIVFLSAAIAPATAAPVQDGETQWRARHDAGLEALGQGRYADAVPLFRAAIREIEEFAPESYNLAYSIGALGETYVLQGDYLEAESQFRRSLGILEHILRPGDPVIAIHQHNLATVYRRLGQPEDAERLYRLSLPILERALGHEDPDVIRIVSALAAIGEERDDYEQAEEFYGRLLSTRWGPGVETSGGTRNGILESLAAVLGFAQFPDEDRDKAIRELMETFAEAQPSPALYIASSRMLSRQQLVAEAEEIMLQAVRAFSDSRRVRTELAEMYAENQKLQTALGVFEEASQMEGPPGLGPGVERFERHLIHTRIGHMNLELGRFDDAMTAFRGALEIDPDAVGARLELAGQYLSRDMLDEAQIEYERVVADSPQTADVHYGLAELNLRQGRILEAAAAAATALEIDPEYQRARYTRVRALFRAGRTEEGQQELAAYQGREAIAQAANDRQVQESALNRTAAAALIDGRSEEAIQLLRDGIEAQPDVALIYLNLGVALGKMGRHETAIEAFETMLSLGCCPLGDSFLVHRSLSMEYAALGDDRSSLRHRALYLREYDRALSAALNRR